jgi:hypothetical protein
MEKNGFTVVTEIVDDMAPIKTRYLVPTALQSCHTAIVDGYVVEGHVPVTEIRRMLDERPDIIGLAVAGMPGSAPGMEGAGGSTGPYDVVAFDKQGRTEVYASYPK